MHKLAVLVDSTTEKAMETKKGNQAGAGLLKWFMGVAVYGTQILNDLSIPPSHHSHGLGYLGPCRIVNINCMGVLGDGVCHKTGEFQELGDPCSFWGVLQGSPRAV